MFMSVVNIGGMPVRMRDGLVVMDVGMVTVRSQGLVVMPMLMMVVVVTMPVVVGRSFVGMRVRMLFLQQENCA